MPHDRFFGLAAEELTEQRPDRDVFARAYATALGDPEKTKAIYIGIRAHRLEEEAIAIARREAELEEERVRRENELRRSAASAKPRSSTQKGDVPKSVSKTEGERKSIAEAPQPKTPPPPSSVQFSDPNLAKAVHEMRAALAASKFKKD